MPKCSAMSLATPVVFVIFNRPRSTERVFAAIAAARPQKLFVIGDGPRPGREGEAGQVAAARAIVQRVDWPCEVATEYSDLNLGCRRRVSSGLDWVFGQVERAIILEDDCLPHASFFSFAEAMLERYAADERVGMVSGDNFQPARRPAAHSYYFSRYVHVWGWATWRRTWRRYDVAMAKWPELRDTAWLARHLETEAGRRYWARAFEATWRGEIETWAHQLTFACWLAGALNVMPSTNLVSNLGFGPDATNTTGRGPYDLLPANEMRFPLDHPGAIARDEQADAYTQRAILDPPLLARLAYNLRDALWS
jgi:hypothetical protein